MFIALTALTATALAVDLDAKLTTPSGTVTSLTFHDVESRPPPTVQLPMRGATGLVTLTVTPKDDTFVVAATLAELDARGRTKTLATPTLIVRAGETGTFRDGKRLPIAGTNPVEFRDEAWELTFVVRP
jgi:Flp pilus assembly secretin CpaC